MKLQKIIRIIPCLLAGLLMYSCNESVGSRSGEQDDSEGIPVKFEISTLQSMPTMNCQLYVFGKDAPEATYTYKHNIALNGNMPVSFPFRNDEIYGKYFRFLFVATPNASAEISTVAQGGGALQTGTEWSDVIIKSLKDSLSQHNYYGIMDKTGSQIINDGKITGSLKRAVGQLVFEFSRVDGSIEYPVDIVSSTVTSVIDRVHKIVIEYERPTTAISFDADGMISSEAKGKAKIIHTIVPSMANYAVTLPQVALGLENHSAGVRGGMSLNGGCMLQATDNMHVKMTFHYYDTTPTCGSGTETDFGVDCYEQKELVLHFPKNNDALDSLTVKPNYYTLNKAGIVHDRVIDLGVTGGAQVFTAWNVVND